MPQKAKSDIGHWTLGHYLIIGACPVPFIWGHDLSENRCYVTITFAPFPGPPYRYRAWSLVIKNKRRGLNTSPLIDSAIM